MNDLHAMVARYHDARDAKNAAMSDMRLAESLVVEQLIDERDTFSLRVDWTRLGRK